jgi:hypothetical protein
MNTKILTILLVSMMALVGGVVPDPERLHVNVVEMSE